MREYKAPINSSESMYQIAYGRRQFNGKEILLETHFTANERGRTTEKFVVPGYYLSSELDKDSNKILREKIQVEPINDLSERKELSDLLNRGRIRMRKARIKVEFWE